MKKILMLSLIVMPIMIHANVIGPRKDGTYSVDKWGAPFEVNNSRIPDELDAKLTGSSDRIKGRF